MKSTTKCRRVRCSRVYANGKDDQLAPDGGRYPWDSTGSEKVKITDELRSGADREGCGLGMYVVGIVHVYDGASVR